MDNLGYRNWNNSLEDSSSFGYESSPSPAYRPSKKGETRSFKSDNVYDFDISQDDDDDGDGGGKNMVPVHQASRKSVVRRSSIDDRAKEILDRNKILQQGSVNLENDLDDPVSSYQSTFADLMEGIEIPQNNDETMRSSVGSNVANSVVDSPFESSSGIGDSFEISEADMEVGTLAARRAKEKANERRRRMSFEYPPGSVELKYHNSTAGIMPAAKITSSPDTKSIRPSDHHKNMADFQMSAALSSIHRSGSVDFNDEFKKSTDMFRYGSVERSDDDLYKMLNISESDNIAKKIKQVNIEQENGSKQVLQSVDLEQDSDNSNNAQQKEIDNENEKSSDEYSSDDFEQPDTIKQKDKADVVVQRRESKVTFSDDSNNLLLKPTITTTSAESERMSSMEMIMRRWSTLDASTVLGIKPEETNENEKKKERDDLEVSLAASSDREEGVLEKEELDNSNLPLTTEDNNLLESQLSVHNEVSVENTSLQSGSEPFPNLNNLEAFPNSLNKIFASVSKDDLVTSIPAAQISAPSQYVNETTQFANDENTKTKEIDYISNLQTDKAVDEISQRKVDSIFEKNNITNSESSPLSHKQSEITVPAIPSLVISTQSLNANNKVSANSPLSLSAAFRYKETEEEEDVLDYFKIDNSEPYENISSRLQPQPAPLLYYNGESKIKEDTTSSRKSIAKSVNNDYNKIETIKYIESTNKNNDNSSTLVNDSKSQTFSLYEHLAETSASNTRRMANATANKLLKYKKKKLLETANQLLKRSHSAERERDYAPTYDGETMSSSLKQRLTEQAKQNISFTENLLSENEKLNRKMGKLEKETQSLRISLHHLISTNSLDMDRKASISVQKLAEENLNNSFKNEEFKIREKSLSMRESLISSKEKLLLNNMRDHGLSDVMENAKMREELSEKIDREKYLIDEINLLKSNLFLSEQNKEIQDVLENNSIIEDPERILINMANSNIAGEKSKLPVAANKSKSYQNYLKLKSLTTTNNVDELISINRSNYDKLLKDYAAQDKLIEGYQLENEKLHEKLKNREKEEAARAAIFYEKQEMLNKEINRLKSGNISDSNTRKSIADNLKNDLEKDLVIRDLQERLYTSESQKINNDKELKIVIEKVQMRNCDIILHSTNNSILTIDKDISKLINENRILVDKLKFSNDSIKWYADNQKIIENAEEEREILTKALKNIKQELKKHKLESKYIDNIFNDLRITETITSNVTNVNDSFLEKDRSFSTDSENNKMRRNPADIKKIRYLESVIKDLDESLSKRNPNSISNLIRATNRSESDTLLNVKCKRQEESIQELNDELSNIRSHYDSKIRSLRQEYNKMKIKYESQIEAINKYYSDEFTSTKKPVQSLKNMGQAISRIRELELEVEKNKRIFAKKLEDNKNSVIKEVYVPSNNFVDNSNNNESNYKMQSKSDDYFEKNLVLYKEQILQLQSELKEVYDELNNLKATTLNNNYSINNNNNNNQYQSQQQEILQTPIEQPDPVPNKPLTKLAETNYISNNEFIEKEILHRLEREQQQQQQKNDIEKSRIEFEYQKKLESQLSEWMIEKNNLLNQIRNAENLSNNLRIELSNLNNQLLVPKTPQMNQFMNMENQIRQLETRLQRREQELLTAIEDNKAAARLEYSRIVSIHQNECRDKDEQLIRFQRDLENLVNTLHQLKSISNKDIKVSFS